MQPFLKHSETSKAVEVLFFDQAEIHKVKGDNISFSSAGPLNVLYLKDYHRFVLQLNDWKYPLLRRLSVSVDPDHSDMSSRLYILPGLNGFSFNLRIVSVPNSQSLTNLETIFSSSCQFSFAGQVFWPMREVDASPDDKLSRPMVRPKDSGPKEVITETVKTIVEKVKVGVATIKTGTVHLTSKKRKLNPKDLKNKNFRKSAKSTFKKDFFVSSTKASQEFMRLRFENKNLSQIKKFSDLEKTSDSSAAVLFVNKGEIEEAILNNKDIALQERPVSVAEPEPERVEVTENKDMMSRVKEGLRDIKDTFITSTRPRGTENVAGDEKKVVEVESMNHYQG